MFSKNILKTKWSTLGFVCEEKLDKSTLLVTFVRFFKEIILFLDLHFMLHNSIISYRW